MLKLDQKPKQKKTNLKIVLAIVVYKSKKIYERQSKKKKKKKKQPEAQNDYFG